MHNLTQTKVQNAVVFICTIYVTYFKLTLIFNNN